SNRRRQSTKEWTDDLETETPFLERSRHGRGRGQRGPPPPASRRPGGRARDRAEYARGHAQRIVPALEVGGRPQGLPPDRGAAGARVRAGLERELLGLQRADPGADDRGGRG